MCRRSRQGVITTLARLDELRARGEVEVLPRWLGGVAQRRERFTRLSLAFFDTTSSALKGRAAQACLCLARSQAEKAHIQTWERTRLVLPKQPARHRHEGGVS